MCAKRAWLFAERVWLDRCQTVRRDTGAFGPLTQRAHLIIEASGGYERELVRVAQQSSVQLSVVNPRQVRDFARGVGRLAKTDPIDAEMLARFGAEVNPPPDAVPTAAEVALQELVSAREQLVEERTVLLQQQAQHLSNKQKRGRVDDC